MRDSNPVHVGSGGNLIDMVTWVPCLAVKHVLPAVILTLAGIQAVLVFIHLARLVQDRRQRRRAFLPLSTISPMLVGEACHVKEDSLIGTDESAAYLGGITTPKFARCNEMTRGSHGCFNGYSSHSRRAARLRSETRRCAQAGGGGGLFGGLLGGGGRVKRVTDEAEFSEAVERSIAAAVKGGAHKKDEGSLLVVKFYATWCRTCKAIAPKYKALAYEYAGPGRAEFLEVEFTTSKDLCKALNVKAVPCVQFYRGRTRLETVVCGAKRFGKVQERLVHYLADDGEDIGECKLESPSLDCTDVDLLPDEDGDGSILDDGEAFGAGGFAP